MNANPGEIWSDADLEDLKHSLTVGNTVADTASMLCRNEDEVRQKARQLGLGRTPW
jgi:hypothetical protein